MRFKIRFFIYLLLAMHTGWAMDPAPEQELMETEQELIGGLPSDLWLQIFNLVAPEAKDISSFSDNDCALPVNLICTLCREIKYIKKELITLMRSCRSFYTLLAPTIELLPMLQAALQQRNKTLVDLIDECGWTALHWAACWGERELIKLLLVAARDNKQKLLMQQEVAMA